MRPNVEEIVLVRENDVRVSVEKRSQESRTAARIADEEEHGANVLERVSMLRNVYGDCGAFSRPSRLWTRTVVTLFRCKRFD